MFMLTETATAGSPLAVAAAPTVVGVGAPDNTGALRRREDVRRHGGMPPYVPPYRNFVGRGALTPPQGATLYPTNSISVYSVLPFKNASASMVAYRVM